MQALLFDKVRSKKILLWERRDLCKMTNPKANLLLTFHEARVSLHSAEMRVKVLYTSSLQSSEDDLESRSSFRSEEDLEHSIKKQLVDAIWLHDDLPKVKSIITERPRLLR